MLVNGAFSLGAKLSWDPEKADANWPKHGVSFEEAGTIFDDPLFVDFFDPDHSDDEQRFVAIGQSFRNRLLLVSYSEWANSIRIISAREATRRERKIFEEGQG
ncbi:MAG: BrnT family toxin [Thermodesulfobacteriota bacterium]